MLNDGNDFRIYVTQNPATDCVDVTFICKDNEGRRMRAVRIGWTLFGADEYLPNSTMSLGQAAASHLMDALWNAGVRPSRYHGTGEVEAMQEHINSLREITNRLLPSPARVQIHP